MNHHDYVVSNQRNQNKNIRPVEIEPKGLIDDQLNTFNRNLIYSRLVNIYGFVTKIIRFR